MEEFQKNIPEEMKAQAQEISDDELGAVAGGAVYPDKYHIQCPACLKLIRKTPEAFDQHNRESGCQYKL